MSRQAQPEHYAKAVYDLALETWTRQLAAVQVVLQGDVGLRTALADAETGTSHRLERLEKAVSGSLDSEVRKFVGTLLEAGQIEQLDAILAELNRLVRVGPTRKTARVTSAVPLTNAEQEAFRQKVTRRFGPDLEFQFEVDPALLGGIVLRVGDQVIDGSIAAKLAALRDQLAA
ncbi:MAG: ATP synthase F1 subunit delta [Anaerolineae bacterium]|nr:ATP synthase F1 subunit delta [Anaerolineae bacterium]